jgi:APA family basic amino acid/polyamine antiporter
VLVRGIRESAEANNIMVLLKIAAIIAFIVAGAEFIHPSNYHPFVPNGWPGILTGGSIIFFTYIGFDSVSTAAEEAKNPQRDLPIGILLTLFICTILYISVAVVLTGLVPWQSVLDDAAPVVNALKRIGDQTHSVGLHWTRLAVLFGAMLGMISSLLVFQLGQARVWFAMSRDGLLPKIFGHVHPRFRTPDIATWIAGFVVGIPAGLFDIGTLANLSNIGTLFAFVLVSLGVLILRYRDPNRRRSFRAPGGPVVPILSVAFCLLLMMGLEIETWIRFFVWLAIGLVIYFSYSRYHSEFAPTPPSAPPQEPKR